MAYADNLYSAVDSDVESFSEELSPTDGYFANRAPAPTPMVPDPSLDTSTSNAQAKAQEAREEAGTNPENTIATSTRPQLDASSSTPSSDFTSPTRLSPYNTSTPTTVTSGPTLHLHTHPVDAYSETSSLLQAVPPPPAYSAAPSSTLEQTPFQSFRQNYRTVSDYELERGLPSHPEPESMGGPSDPDERTPLWRRQIPQLPPLRHFLRHILFTTLVLSLLVSFVVTAIKFSKNTPMSKHPNNGLPTPDGSNDRHGPFCSAATIHVQDSMPTYEFQAGERLGILQVNSDKAMPPGPNILSTKGQINIRPLPADSKDPNTGLITFDAWVSHPGIPIDAEMDAESQALRIATPRSTTISGSATLCISLEINVWLPDGISFGSFQVFSSDLSINVFEDLNVSMERGAFQTFPGAIVFPTLNETELETRGYVDRSKKSLETTERDTATDNVLSDAAPAAPAYPSMPSYPIPPSPPIPPTPPTPPTPPVYPTSPAYRKPSAPSHDDAPWRHYPSSTKSRGFHSREIYIETTSGSIRGAYHLFDVLTIASRSGSVNVIVIPEPVLKTDPKPAKLLIETMSGSIYARHPVYNSASMPVRDYRSRVTSYSGSLTGSFIIGTDAVLKTTSGQLDVVALPDSTTQSATFSTECSSGSSQINVLSPFTKRRSPGEASGTPFPDIGEDDPYILIPYNSDLAETDPDVTRSRTALRKLRSQHMSTSGSQKIRYPSAWEGQIDAEAISGSIRVGGDGVRTIKDNRKNWAYKQVVARKGLDAEHASAMIVHGVSGSEEIWIGDNCTDDGRWCKP